MKPTIGRIVHVILRDASMRVITRPGIITRTWDNTMTVQVTVFPDVINDGLGAAHGLSSVQYDETQTLVGDGGIGCSWHWPPRA